MSRFGIRNKIKKMLAREREEISTWELVFLLPDGSERRVRAEDRYSIAMAADASGLTINTGHRAGGACPDGRCASCLVEVEDATGISAMAPAERQSLDDRIAGKPHEGRERDPAPPMTPLTRLACHARIIGSGARVRIPELFEIDAIKGDAEGS